MIPWRKATLPTVDNFLLQFDDSFPPLFGTHQLQKEHTKLNPVSSFSLYSHTSQHTQSTTFYSATFYSSLTFNMPGPDPRKTKPSAYTIPKAGSSKPVGDKATFARCWCQRGQPQATHPSGGTSWEISKATCCISHFCPVSYQQAQPSPKVKSSQFEVS